MWPIHTKMYDPAFERKEKRKRKEDFPGGPVVKDPPASAGDSGPIPGPGRSHMPQSNYTRAQRLSLCPRAWEPQLLSPTSCRVCVSQQEKPPQ